MTDFPGITSYTNLVLSTLSLNIPDTCILLAHYLFMECMPINRGVTMEHLSGSQLVEF